MAKVQVEKTSCGKKGLGEGRRPTGGLQSKMMGSVSRLTEVSLSYRHRLGGRTTQQEDRGEEGQASKEVRKKVAGGGKVSSSDGQENEVKQWRGFGGGK